MPENPKTPASEGGREHTLETAADEGSGYGGPFPVDPEREGADADSDGDVDSDDPTRTADR